MLNSVDMKATLIQCTKSKRSETCRAKDLYDESTYFCKLREWAESRGQPWYILSAKHGLVAPNEFIEPYNEFGLSKSQAIEIALLLRNTFDAVDICAGEKYTKHLIPELKNDGIEVKNHFAGKGIGERMSLLKESTNDV